MSSNTATSPPQGGRGVDLSSLSAAELHNKLEEIKQICLNNTDLSAHLLELKIREMQLIHEELEARKPH